MTKSALRANNAATMIVEPEETIAVDQLVHSISMDSRSLIQLHSLGDTRRCKATQGWSILWPHYGSAVSDWEDTTLPRPGPQKAQLNETPTPGDITTQGLLILYMMSKVVNLNVRCDRSQSSNFRSLFLLRLPPPRLLSPEDSPSPCPYLTNRKISFQKFAIPSWVPFIWKVGSSSNTRKSDSARTATVRSLGRLRSNRS